MNEKIGHKIKYVRMLKQFERKQVADKLNITVQQLANIENNVNGIDEDRLNAIANIFGMSVETIRNINPEQLVHQINNDFSIGFNLGTIHH